MQVRDLIEELKRFDPRDEVAVEIVPDDVMEFRFLGNQCGEPDPLIIPFRTVTRDNGVRAACKITL